jgi:hypothetical protein
MFVFLLILVAGSIASVAAYFSIYGLAQIFSGTFYSVVAMGVVLELGKLVAASYVYRYWSLLGMLMKTYLITAIFVLMVITSSGIFGYLSQGNSKNILPLELMEQQIVLLSQENIELDTLKTERLFRRKQIDADIAALPNNFITGRQRLMESYGPELQQIRSDIKQYTSDIRENTLTIRELKHSTLETEAEIGPIIFIAESFGFEVQSATKWLILLIIFAFDPLAVVLTIGVNIIIVSNRKPPINQTPKPRYYPEDPTPVLATTTPSTPPNENFKEHVVDPSMSIVDIVPGVQPTPDEIVQRDLIVDTDAKKQIKEKVTEQLQQTLETNESKEPVKERKPFAFSAPSALANINPESGS